MALSGRPHEQRQLGDPAPGSATAAASSVSRWPASRGWWRGRRGRRCSRCQPLGPRRPPGRGSEVELGRGDLEVAGGRGRGRGSSTGRAASSAGRTSPGTAGCARGSALGPQLLHQALEGEILVGVGVQGERSRTRASSSANAGSPASVGAQHQAVDEEADEGARSRGGCGRRWGCPRPGRPGRCRRRRRTWKAASRVMNRVAPCSAAEGAQAARRAPGRGRTGDGGAAEALHGRARPVGGQVEGGRRVRQELPLPVGQLALQGLALQPVALPDGEVGVLDRQLRQGRRRPAAKALVEGGELADQHAHGPAVGDDVVQVEQQGVLLRARGRASGGAQQRPAGEVERPAAASAGQARAPRRAPRPERGPERSTTRQGPGQAARRDDLHRLALPLGEGGAQRPRGGAPPRAGRPRRAAGLETAPRAPGRWACCRRRGRARAGRGTRAAPGRRRGAGRRSRGTRDGCSAARGSCLRRPGLLDARPGPPGSGASKTRGAAGRRRSVSRSRETSWVASREWPPSSKKSSLDARRRSHSPGPRPRCRPAAPRPGVRGGRERLPAWRAGGSGRSAARAPRSSLPLGVSGRAGRGATKTAGTMGSGRRSARKLAQLVQAPSAGPAGTTEGREPPARRAVLPRQHGRLAHAGMAARAASISPSSMRKPRILTWWSSGPGTPGRRPGAAGPGRPVR